MKKFIVMAAIVLSTVACSNDSELTNVVANQKETAPVTVRVNDFSITTEEMPSGGGMTRAAQDPDTYFNKGGAITLAFYNVAGTEVYKTTQVRDDGTYTTFGQFTANLPVGTYTMVAIGRFYDGSDVFTLTSPTEAAFTSERPRETFSKVQSVVVTTAGVELNVTLNRIVPRLDIESTDNRPAGIAKIRTTYAKGGKSFDPTTGLATTDAGFVQTNTPSAAVGSTIRVSSYPFLYTDEETMNITIEVLDADDNVLFTHTVNNVPFKRNRKTTLRGNIFTAGTSSAGFQLETSWLTDADPINF